MSISDLVSRWTPTFGAEAGVEMFVAIFAVLTALTLLVSGPLATVTVLVLWGLAVLIVLASLAAALSGSGLLRCTSVTREW